MKSIPFILFNFSLSVCGLAQKIVLEGSYQNKNIYIQNPAAAGGKGFCTDSVFVNGSRINFLNTDAFEIKLDSVGLKTDDRVTVQIFHKPDCKPMVLSDHSMPRVTFDLVSISVDPNGLLSWTTRNEKSQLPFIVEQFRWNKWIVVGEVDGLGGSGENSYSFQTSPHSGENQYRVKQVDSRGPRLSKPVALNLPDQDVQILGNKEKLWEAIHFNKKTMYELWDEEGNLIKKGEGSNIGIKGVKKASYYLNYDNRMEMVTIESK